jgi:tetratricopeptide (TPR) repeat protein
VKYTTSPLSLIKSLLLQLLDREIGREDLLTRITNAIHIASRGGSLADVENTLWSALETSLHDKKIMIVIDGLDQLSGVRIGNPPALEILNRITKEKRNVKAIVLCRPVSDSALKHCQESLVLEDVRETTGDIEHYVQDFIQHRSELRRLKESDKQSIIQKYTEAAKGSFLWLELQLQSVKHEESASAILKACQKAPKSVDESLDQLISNLDTKRPETKHILSWILAAERPLAVKEVKSLLEIDLDGTNADFRMFSGDVEKTIAQSCGSLVVIRDGLVYLRHPSIRERLASTTSASNKNTKLVIDPKEAHRELTLRCLAHVKIQLQHDDVEPQADLYDAKEMALVFKKHHLFEYATRYWILHFRASSLFDKSSGKFNLSALFKNAFPGTIRLALFEGSCLARQYIAIEGEKLQNLAYNIRKTLFGEHTTAVLQSLLLELKICKKFKSASVLSEYAYDAWKISHRAGCSVTVVHALAEAFIEYSVSLSVTQHSDFCSRKEEILEYLIEVYQDEHNESKEVHYLQILAELYIEIRQVQKAVVIYRRLHRLRLQVCGHLHEETHTLFKLLITYLKELSLHDEVLEITLEYYEYLEQTLVITDERRVNITVTVIELYEERKEIHRAEEILVRFWNSVSVSTTKTTRITELKVDFALKYSNFLYRYSRKEESEVILRGMWTEIQTYSYEARFESTMIKRVQTIAKYFESLEIFTMSRSIYQSLYEHYESHEERTSTECISIVRSLSETITKSISRSKTTSTSTSTTSTSTTTIISKEEIQTLLEVFEFSMESTEISSTTISICQALCSSYMYEEKYEEACEIYSRVIKKVWASIETTTVEVSVEITEHFTEEIFELCINLAICHFKMLHIEIAASIYINLFRALIITRHIENKHFLLAKIKIIIAFFQEIYQYERVIEIYRELFIWMPICFGKTHRETIIILIEFARICFRMRLYHEASTACTYVYSCFHTSGGCLHYDGFAAAFLLCEIYEIQCQWELAYEVYGYLWRTFVRFGFEYELDVKIVEKIFRSYLFILEHKEMVEYSVLLQVSKEYYESCVKFYKYSHEITIKATLEYAHICERREEHHETSISLYKEVIKYCKETKSEFSKTTLHKTETRIAKLYSSSTKEITKAISIYSEQFESCRKTESSSTETITALYNLVSTYKKQSTTESITKATSTLKTCVLEIFQSESHSEKLIESAQSIAKIYKECSFNEQATTLIQEMRSKVVEEVRTSITSSSSSTKSEKKSYVFLASFQESFSESSSFSSVMAELRTEMLMYESYFKATSTTKTTTSVDYRSVIQSGASLYFHLEKKSERRGEFIKIEKELTEYFCKYLSFSRTVKDSVLHFFFEVYLKQSGKTAYEHEVVRQASEAVLRFTKTAKFAEAYDLVLLIDRFIHLHGGFQSEFYIRTGFNLSKYLVGIDTHKCSDAKLYTAMLDLSRVILQEALKGLDKIDIELVELQQLLADLVSMLSEQKKYEDLERILQTLWQTRTIRNNMSSSPLVLYIGRSLVQTLASLNKFSDAIHLCYHIRYNLAYIRGALDKSTLDFTILLSELYTEQKRYKDAMELHSDILCRLGEGQTAPGLEPLKEAHTHTELLKLAYQRAGKFDKSPQHYYDVFAALDQRFGDDKVWVEKRPQLEKWTPVVKEGETFGCWKRPTKFEWEFEGGESAEETKWREELVKRRVSGKFWFGGKKIEEEKGDDYFGKVLGKVGSNGHGHVHGNGNGNGHAHAHAHGSNGDVSKSGLI